MDSEIQKIFGPAMDKVASGDCVTRDGQSRSAEPVASPIDNGGEVKSEAAKEVVTQPMSELARFVMDNFRVNSENRRDRGSNGVSVADRLTYSLMSASCTYNGRQTEALLQSGIDPKAYPPLTSTKIRTAKSMLVNLTNSGGEPLFSMEPTPEPNLPLEIEREAIREVEGELNEMLGSLQAQGVKSIPEDQLAAIGDLVKKAAYFTADNISNSKDSIARKRAKRMEKKVWDLMVEGGWDKAFGEYLNHICTFGTCVMCGPIMKNVAKNIGETDEKTKVYKVKREVVSIPTYEALNPIDCYPAPNATEVTDGPLCVRVRYVANDLWRLASDVQTKGDIEIKSDGWIPSVVNSILCAHPQGGVRIEEDVRSQEVRSAENKGLDNSADCTFEGIRCFASVRGSVLREMGIVKNMSGENINHLDYYWTETIVIDNKVVYCRIFDDRLGLPLFKGVFYELPGSWWGESIAEKLGCCQFMVNNTIKALATNMSVASGPQIWMNNASSLLDRSSEGLKMFPLKIWQFGNPMGLPGQQSGQGAPMGVLNVPSNAQELIQVFNAFEKQADLDSGLPAFSEGTGGSNGGALRTAEGLKVYTEASNRGMQMVISITDRLVITGVAKYTADWLLIYGDDMSLKGDVTVMPIGLMGKILKAQNDQARLQLFNMILNNQFLLQMIGAKGVVELFRPSLKDLNINPDNVVPGEERMKFIEKLEKLKMTIEAMNPQSASERVNQEGAPPGVDQPPAVEGAVSQRRNAA